MDTPKALTVNETARLLNVSPQLVRQEARRGHLPSFRVGGAVRIPRQAVEALLSGERREVASDRN